MKYEDLTTKDRILQEAISLIAENGFKGTSIKAIAENAGVSEMTVFRHFKTKNCILDEAIERFSFGIELKKEMEEKIKWNLEEDLILVSNLYHNFLNLNEKVFLIKIKEGAKHSCDNIRINTGNLTEFLINYFSEMQKLGKIIEVDSKALAVSFISTNLAFFMDGIIPEVKLIDISLDEFINNNIKIFARGLTP